MIPSPHPSPDPPPGFPLLRLNYSVGHRIRKLMFQPAGFVQVSPKNHLFSYILHYTTLLGEVHLKAILNFSLGQNSAVITPLNKTSVM